MATIRIDVAAVLALSALTGACTLGESTGDPSPYTQSAIMVANPTGVADGATGVDVMITGPIGARLTLVAGGGAHFVAADGSSGTEKTVFLTDAGGVGQATAQVTSTTVGSASVSFKPDPLRTPRKIEFVPVRAAAGTAVESAFQPGMIEHRVCVAVNSAFGSLRADNLTGTQANSGQIQSTADVTDKQPAGLACPTEAVDEIGWHGWATFVWRTSEDSADVDLVYLGPGDTELSSETVTLHGSAFPGYTVTAATPDVGTDFVSVTLSVTYPATGALASAPADGVTVTERFIPEPGPTLLGSSSGGPDDPIVTGADGDVTLFFDPSATGTYAWFVTLSGNYSYQLDDLTIP